MVDRDTFRRLIRDGLAHLYEPAYLLTHPLTRLLIEARLIRTADQAAAFLINAIAQLHPPGNAPRNSPGWRQYRYLQLRYVECASHRRIANELGLSTRQASREHDAGLVALTELLWQRYAATGDGIDTTSGPLQTTKPSVGNAGPGVIDVELRRLGIEMAEGPVSLDEVLTGVLATISRLAQARDIGVVRPAMPALPSVMANRLGLRHLLLNLIGYLIEQAGVQRITIDAQASDEVAELYLSAEVESETAKLFLDAEQVAPELSAAQALATAQGFELRVEASSQTAPRIVLRLPAVHARRILLVDDNPDVGRLFRRFIGNAGYSLKQARSAESALRMIRESPPDVILLDILLPRNDGWQLLEQMRAEHTAANVPVIACSVIPEQSLAYSLGVVAFLPKPVTQEALLSALAQWCPLETGPGNPDNS